MENSKLKLRFYIIAALMIALLAAVWGQKRFLPKTSNADKTVFSAAAADKRQSYVADVRTSIFYKGRKINVMSKMYHTPAAERVEYVTGPPKGIVVITRDGKTYSCDSRTKETALSVSAQAKSSSERLQLLMRNHIAALSGEAHVAGRQCQVVDIIPRDFNSPSKRLWIDKSTFVILRIDDSDLSGRRRSSSEFTRIRYVSHLPSGLFISPNGKCAASDAISQPLDREALSKRLGFKVTPPKYIPAGYTLDGYTLFKCSCKCGHESAHIIYTNGLNTLSVFETKSLLHCGAKVCDPSMRQSMDCRVNSNEQGQTAVITKGKKTVLVIGNLPDAELVKVARSTP
ncbi:MAG: sigma-E factor regulatory protein RseB domain-containing protein [Armatimonadota bacterium]|nr:sigma-E factor regulatory protein RseB domain-containing protein [Armatimonadota bacterium]